MKTREYRAVEKALIRQIVVTNDGGHIRVSVSGVLVAEGHVPADGYMQVLCSFTLPVDTQVTIPAIPVKRRVDIGA